MSLFSDLMDAIEKINSDKLTDAEKIKKLSGAVAAFFGLPVKNVLRDMDSAVNVYKDFSKEKKFSSEDTLYMFKDEMNETLGFKLFKTDYENAVKNIKHGNYETYEKYADKVYASDDAYDLLYSVLKKYGYSSSEYKQAEEQCIKVKKENGSKEPNPKKSMKTKAIKEYSELRGKKGKGKYKQAEEARQLCMSLYGDMTAVEEALEKLEEN